MKKSVIVAIYVDSDFYPPTINAILNLSEVFEEVVVVSRNNTSRDFPYPPNVRLKKIGVNCTVREMEKQPFSKKLFYFLKFLFTLLKYSKQQNTRLLLIYDHIALFAYYLINPFIKNKKVWYHNHDMPNKQLLSSFSIGGLGARFESAAMTKINFFSLPSKERLKHYPLLKKGIQVFIIPNYPSLKVYNHFEKFRGKEKYIRIIYQGFIGSGHSLEEIIKLLPEEVNGQRLELILKGSVTDTYRSSLEKLAKELSVQQQIIWLPIGPYSELPQITLKADIGIGINKNTDIVSLAQGTASNKIYEYAASGLPVILYKSEQFEKYLAYNNWAFFSDGSLMSLRKTIEKIVNNLENLSIAARNDFEERLNYEKVFKPVMKDVIKATGINFI